MERIQLIHWNDAEARLRASRIREAGYEVSCELPAGPRFLRDLRDHPPRAVVIDLSRLPSQGGDLALAIRHQKSTRHVPLVFVDGDREKVATTKTLLPNAVYTRWNRIAGSLKKAIAHPPAKPVTPPSVFAGYSGTTLVKKLGIKQRFTRRKTK